MTERERNREIIQEWSPEVLEFMDQIREVFEGARLTELFCDVEEQWGKK